MNQNPCPPVSQAGLDERLVLSAMSGSMPGLLSFLEQGANPLSGNSRALAEAARNGYPQVLNHLMPLSNPRDAGSRALALAAENGHAECVKQLIPFSDPKVQNSRALRMAAMGGHEECARLLFSVSHRLSVSLAPFQAALKAGHAPLVAMMLDHDRCIGTTINLADCARRASKMGHHETAAVLLSAHERQTLFNATALPAARQMSPHRL